MTLVYVFAAIFALITVVDVWLVETGRRSISVATWLAETAHPTIICGVFIFGLTLGYMVSALWWLVLIVGVATGHLVTSEGAAIAQTLKPARWKRSVFQIRPVRRVDLKLLRDD